MRRKMQLAPRLLLLTILQLYIAHLLLLLQSVTLPACSLDASQCARNCALLLYFLRYHTVILKIFIFVFVFYICIICVKSIINLLQYSTI